MKLDIGCGLAIERGWTGFEKDKHKINRLRSYGFPIIDGDLGEPWPIKDNSVEEIKAKEVIEHLTVKEAWNVLKEAERVLVPGGLFNIYTLFVRRSFWYSFDHTKPYPPQAFLKLCDGRHKSGKIDLKVIDVKYKKKWGVWPVGYWITLKK